MKKSWLLGIITAMCLLCLTGCGEKFHVEEMQLFDKESLFEGENLSDWHLAGSQYEQGEPVQLWAHMPYYDEDGNPAYSTCIYKYSVDGENKTLIENVTYGYLLAGRWWYDEQGCMYVLQGDGIAKIAVVEDEEIITKSMEVLFFNQTDENVKDICQLSDGRIIVLMKKYGVSRVAELNTDTGEMIILENVILGEAAYDAVGVGKKGVLLVSREGIRDVDLETGEAEMLVPFKGTDYAWKEKLWADFRLCEDGAVEILWENGKQEKIWYGKVKKNGAPIVTNNMEPAENSEENEESNLKNDKETNGVINKNGYKENGENGEYYDIQVEEQPFPEKSLLFSGKTADDWKLIGSQYDGQGKPIQLWAEMPVFDKDNNVSVAGDVYLYREDGSRELVLQNIPYASLYAGRWWCDKKGQFYVLETDGIRGFDREGSEIFHTCTGENVKDICQLSDGRIMVLMKEMGNSKIAELNPENGVLKKSETVLLSVLDYNTIGAGRKGILLVSNDGIREVDLETGDAEMQLPLTGTTYAWNNLLANDLLLHEDGSLEVLWEDGRQENLRYEKVSGDKKLIVVRCGTLDEWTKSQIVRFNRTNKEYCAVLVECTAIGTEYQAFCERTDMEIAAGQGADIICYHAVNDEYSLISKGAFEDLTPYIQQTGIRTEDYFPFMTGWSWEDKVYGIGVKAELRGVKIDKKFAVKGENITPDILMDRMLENTEKAVFMEGWDAGGVLNYLLRGSEDLWGMINWEQYTCKFDNERFYKMLEVAKKYEDTDTNGYPAIADWQYCDSFDFYERAEQLEREGKVSAGYLFEDGYYKWLIANLMAINKDSDCKEGAWELLAFLLSEETQSTINDTDFVLGFPASREAYNVLKEDAVTNETFIRGNVTYVRKTLPKEQAEDLTRDIENARCFPMRTQPILDIVMEETQEYFSGIKTPEEVVGVIENRVQLFLDEIK